MQTLLMLGRQPALGLAELESLFGAPAVQPWGNTAATVDAEEVSFARLGGSIKAACILATENTTDIRKLQFILIPLVSESARLLDGKVQLGISAHGLQTNPQQLLATGLTLKKALRKDGKSVRLVPNKELELNSASVLHNNLTGPNGIEIILVANGSKTIIARTTGVQDIDSYTLRDRGRPKRDARVGMLPPKLAQIIINMAVAGSTLVSEFVVLDPFCGTGVVLQEAGLMGFGVYGTDIEKRMVEYSESNLEWLAEQHPAGEVVRKLEQGDATNHKWDPVPHAVACEGYLGRPFTTMPKPEVLVRTVSECNTIIKKFLRNIGDQIAPGTRLCLAVPAWQVRRDAFKHLPLIDSLEELGYNHISFEHARVENLLYYRSDQVVARELLVLVKR